MRKKIIAGNWKMHKTQAEALALCNELHTLLRPLNLPKQVRVVVCPPFLYLGQVKQCLEHLGSPLIYTGAQNCHQQPQGAYTGEVAAPMLQAMGIPYVILGHSERRAYFAETNQLLKAKTDAALAAGLHPIFCCGEQEEQRNNGAHFDTVRTQLEQSLFHLSPSLFEQVVIAYEPVWAIGTGKTAQPYQAQEMHAFIRQLVADNYGKSIAENTTILYGGSCNAANAPTLFTQPDVDGGLIGGASLKAPDFAAIVQAMVALESE